MKFIIGLIFIMLIQSCEVPPRARYQNPGNFQDVGVSESGTQSEFGGTTTTTPTEQTGENPQVEPGFEDCSLNYNHSLNNMGYIGLCQNRMNLNQFKFKMSQSDTSVGTCFVPVHIRSNGNSFKLGTAECVHNQANKIYYMTLRKERSEELNGVMVIRANSLNAYMQCMNAKADYMRQNPGCEYEPRCRAEADQYAYNVCNQFKNNHYNNYKQLNL